MELLLLGDPLTWDEAQVSCRAKGGDLVSIYDSADQDFVHQLIQKTTFGEAWIGLNDLRTYNQYEWSDSYVVSLKQILINSISLNSNILWV